MKSAAPPQCRPPILVIGVGNAHRGDDAVGLVIARCLREATRDAVIIHEITDDGLTLIDLWKNALGVIVVDAMQAGAAPGTIYRIDASTQPIPATYHCSSTHAFGVAATIELGRALQQLPAQVIVYGVEGKDFTPGAALSPEVEHVVNKVVEQLWEEVDRWRETKEFQRA